MINDFVIFLERIHLRIRPFLISIFKNYLYISYWHFLVFKKNDNPILVRCFFAATPNPGAGIGHQIANWTAGYYYSDYFGLQFAHIPFSNQSWDLFLGFGEKEKLVSKLKSSGWKIRRLPLFHEGNMYEMSLIKNIISSYSGEKIIFLCEQDQFLRDQYRIINIIQDKFYSSFQRKYYKPFLYSSENLNIAIHIRRGDILSDTNNPNLRMRYLETDYYISVLKQVINRIIDLNKKPVHVWIFSQGNPEDFKEIEVSPNTHLCLSVNEIDSFCHLVFSDILITSKSGFSYTAALLNKGIKICPLDFWHGYPPSNDWFMVNNNGKIIFNN